MKKFFYSLFLLPFLVVLSGCPFDSAYPIDETPLQNVEENILGKWTGIFKTPTSDNLYTEKLVQLFFEKKSATAYDFWVTGYKDKLKNDGKPKNDTLKGTAYISSVSDRQFFNVQLYGRYYIAEFIQEKHNVGIKMLAENFTAKFIKTSQDLRNAIDFHFKTRAAPNYDDWLEITNLKKED